MKKLLYPLAALAALTMTARPAAAQYPAPGPYGPYAPVQQAGCTQCDGGGYGYGGYGYGIGIKDKLLGHGFLSGHFFGLFTNHGGGGGGGPGNTLPAVDPRSGNAGQLAYPQNPFWRGPRDYFMWDER